MNIYERDRIRQLLITEIYKHTNADTQQPIDLEILGVHLKIESSEIGKAYHYLLDEHLVENYGTGYTVVISHYGIKQVESFTRKIDFDEDRNFDTTEIYQLRIILDEIKEQISKQAMGQEIIFNAIDEVYENSKTEKKDKWKENLETKVKDWATQKIIDKTGSLIFQSLLVGLKVIND